MNHLYHALFPSVTNRLKSRAAFLGLSMACAGLVSAQTVLDVNNISTTVRPRNLLFATDNMGSPDYEVPKGSGNHSMYLGALWFTGVDANGMRHNMVEKLDATPDTWPGPLTTDGTASITQPVMTQFDRVWKVSQAEITALQQAQANGSLAGGTYTPPADILQWPGNGPSGYAAKLAPFHDANADGQYNINQGDYPIIKGEQMLFWILNDKYGTHGSGSPSIGLEIHVSMYACKNMDATGSDGIVNYTTFLEYLVINRGTLALSNAYAAFNAETDIGYAFDDYTGTHVDANAFYFYNGDEIDAAGQTPAAGQYGTNWPIQSVQFLEATHTDNAQYLNSYVSYPIISASSTPASYGYLMRGFFEDGSQLVYGGNGHAPSPGATTLPARYMYPALSDMMHVGTNTADPGFTWTETETCPACLPNTTGDRRGVGAVKLGDFGAGDSTNIVLGLITTFENTFNTQTRIEKNREQCNQLKQWYDNKVFPCVMETGTLDVETLPAPDAFVLYPNPAGAELNITGAGIVSGTDYTLLDMNGRVILSDKTRQDGLVNISVQSLSPGVYFVRLADKNGQPHVSKFVKR